MRRGAEDTKHIVLGVLPTWDERAVVNVGGEGFKEIRKRHLPFFDAIAFATSNLPAVWVLAAKEAFVELAIPIEQDFLVVGDSR